MKHMDLADYMRENYSIVVDKNSSRFAKFLAKYTAYSLDDRVVSSAKEVKTEGYIEITSECKLVVEDILYNLVKLQTEKEVAVAFTPGKKVIAYNKKFKDGEAVLEGDLYEDIRQINEDWLRGGYIKNAISTTLGGYSMVHHIYNTERYMTGKIKKYLNHDFEQYVLLPSGLKFLWLLKQFKYNPDKQVVFYDVSSYPLAFVNEMISEWDGITPLHDWALENPVTKGILIGSGQTNEGIRPGMGPSFWNDCWQRELDEFGGTSEIRETLNLLKQGRVKGNVSFINLNIAFDNFSTKLMFKNLHNDSTVLWLSNIFDSSPISAYTASQENLLYRDDARKNIAERLYTSVKNLLPTESLVIGSVPVKGEWQGWDWKD